MNKRQAIGLSVIGALVLVILLLAVTGVWAEPDAALPAAPADIVSNTISYQGRLLDGEGNPVDGITVMTFSLYAGATGGTPLWRDRLDVPVNGGLFDVTLGVNPGLFDGQALWLGVQVEGDTQELQPRRQLLPVPYAFHALTARWSGLMDVPPGFADGIDDDTIYFAGPGLTLNGTDFAITTTYRLPQSCGDGQIAEWDATSKMWYCGDDDVGGGSAAWLLSGNAGTTYDADFLGTTDAVSLTLIAGGGAALRLEPTAGTPNLLGGSDANRTTAGIYGATIGGGGSGAAGANRVTDNYGTVSGGVGNQAGNDDGDAGNAGYATVGGGRSNSSSGENATVSGGYGNVVTATSASIGGGYYNTASGADATVGGGFINTVSGLRATVGGGSANAASGDYAAVGGGGNNVVTATYGTIAGGRNTTVTGDYAAVGGGWDNTASGNLATVSGGDSNAASGDHATIGGGGDNVVTATYGTIAGGGGNEASGPYATVPGGLYNTASGIEATVGGGYYNTASGDHATIGGGADNVVTATYGTIAGGLNSIVTGDHATVGGGYYNTASGDAATVSGGWGNIASGNYSFAAGSQGKATHPGSFVWSSSESTASWSDNTFTVRAHGGVRFYSASGTGTGVQLSSGGTSWASISDRNAKENFSSVDTERLLETLAAMPIQTWNLKAQPLEMRHVGPVAQDFNGEFAYLFGEVESPVHINNMDAVGISLAAAQGLYERSQKQATRIAELETENTALQQQLGDLEARVAALEAASRASQAPGLPAIGWWLLGGLAVVAAVVGQRRFLGGGR
jgi:hypothetical protein